MEKVNEIINKIKKHPKELIIVTFLFCVFLSVIGVTWAWFSPIDIPADGMVSTNVETANLSIAYTNGNEIKMLNALPGATASKTFTVENTGDTTATYDITWGNLINGFSDKSDLVYKLESTDNNLSYTILPNTGSNIQIMSGIKIPADTTHTYTLTVLFKNTNVDQSDNQNKSLIGKIAIPEVEVNDASENAASSAKSLANKLKARNTPGGASTTPGSAISATDEGLISGKSDNDGYTYYFRGNVEDNYVSFAGLTWRVVRINGDGSVRMILNNTISDVGTEGNTEVDTTTSSAHQTAQLSTVTRWLTYDNAPIKSAVESWYWANIGNNANYAKHIEIAEYCSDLTHSGTTNNMNFGTNNRISSPEFTCSSDYVYNLPIGHITADEALFAGAKYNTSNSDYYLALGSIYWTMSPAIWDSSNGVRAFDVRGSGSLDVSYISTTDELRPVISLKASTLISNASEKNLGTSSNPYTIN